MLMNRGLDDLVEMHNHLEAKLDQQIASRKETGFTATDVQTMLQLELGMGVIAELSNLNQQIAALSKQLYDARHA